MCSTVNEHQQRNDIELPSIRDKGKQPSEWDFDTDLSTLISLALVRRAPRDSFILISFFLFRSLAAAWPYDSMDIFAKSQPEVITVNLQ
jgi:hypothetical protein